MARWYLRFEAPEPRTTLGIADFERALSALAGGLVTTTIGELSGNPRDGHDRTVTFAWSHRQVHLHQLMRSPEDVEIITAGIEVVLEESESFATRLATWRDIRTALATLGCFDTTLTRGGSPIVDDVEASGAAALAAELRAEATAFHIAQLSHATDIYLRAPVGDIAAVLAAHAAPETVTKLMLERCGLRTLRTLLARFSNLRVLQYEEQRIDGRVLRGLALPALETLYLRDAGIRTLGREDVAGFPALTYVNLDSTRLTALDPAIIEVCPRLERVSIEHTPLEKDAPAIAALLARWTHVKLAYQAERPPPPPPYVPPPRNPIWTAVTLPDPPPPPPPPPPAWTREFASPRRRSALPAELRGYLDAVIAERDDDRHRRVFADALIEIGDPQGELIHLQCDLAAGGLPRDEAVRRRRRERELLGEHAATWALGVRGRARFARGFVDEVDIDANTWVEHGAHLFAVAPALRAITLTGLHTDAYHHGSPAAAAAFMLDRFAQALASPHLRHLSGLGHSSVGYGHRESQWDMYEVYTLGEQAMKLLAGADLPHLRALAVTAPGLAGMRELARARVVARLERLRIERHASESEGDPDVVLAAVSPERLTSLAIDEWHDRLAGLTALRELEICASTAPVGYVSPALTHLSYKCQNRPMTSDDVAAVTESPHLVELELIATDLAGWRALEHAQLPALRVLRVISPAVTIEHLRELQRWPIGGQLEVLQILKASEAEHAELESRFGCLVETSDWLQYPTRPNVCGSIRPRS